MSSLKVETMGRRIQSILSPCVAAVIAATLTACSTGPGVARFTIFVTGNTKGYLENCGCATGQAGGVQRRAKIVNSERESAAEPIPGDRGRPNAVYLIDVGNFSDPGDPVRRLLSMGVVRAMGVQKYDASGIGLNELSLPQEELLSLLKQTDPPLSYTAANVSFSTPATGEDHSGELSELIKPYLVLKGPAKFRLGLVHIIDDAPVKAGRRLADGYGISAPVQAARAVMAAHRKEADVWILTIADAERNGIRAEDVAGLEGYAIVSNLTNRNPLEAKDSTVALLPMFADQLYDKGKDLVEINCTLTREGDLRMTATKFGVKETYKPDPDVQAVIDTLQPELETLQTSLAEEALNSRKSAVSRPVYLGYQSCYPCHKVIVDQMMPTKHMHAYQTLQRVGKEHMECAKCHNVGYNLPGGWNVIEDRKRGAAFFDRRNVQCENCHGPGDYHILMASGESLPADFSADGRDEFGLQPANEKTCIKCHFGENDPHFDFKTYWPKIAHGMDGPLPLTKPDDEEPSH
jgi:Cytochrome c554 and c-prime